MTQSSRSCSKVLLYFSYGLTETCAVGFHTLDWDYKSSGTIGSIHSCLEFKLVDVPELGYRSSDLPRPRGEICFRGECCTSSYYKS